MNSLAKQPVPRLRDRPLVLRDRLLASPAFQRWAVAFPLTRPIARRRAQALFDLCAGFVYSQILFAAVRLELPRALAGQPQTLHALADRLSLSPDAASRLLDAAVALCLAEKRGNDRFGLGALGAALLGNPAVTAMVEHHKRLYADLADPVALLRGGLPETGLARYWPYAGADRPADLSPDQVGPYSGLMAASQPSIAEEVIAAYRFRRHRCLLDVGGGEGVFLAAVAQRAPRLRLMLFDLPAVAARAEARLAATGLAGRMQIVGGDFLQDALPRGSDLVSLVRVVHDQDDARALALLRAVRRALPEGGAVLIAEPMAGTRGIAPVADAYFGFYLLAMGRGRARTPEAIASLLRQAGFARIKLLPTRRPMLTRVMLATAAPTLHEL